MPPSSKLAEQHTSGTARPAAKAIWTLQAVLRHAKHAIHAKRKGSGGGVPAAGRRRASSMAAQDCAAGGRWQAALSALYAVGHEPRASLAQRYTMLRSVTVLRRIAAAQVASSDAEFMQLVVM